MNHEHKTIKPKDETATTLQSQFKENTGRAICDSGGSPEYDSDGKYIGSKYGYGRGYERLHGVDMDSEPSHSLKISKYGIEYSKSAYHALKDILRFVPNMDALWQAFYVLCSSLEGLDNQWMSKEHDKYEADKAESLAEIVKRYPDADTDKILVFCDDRKDDYPMQLMEAFPTFLTELGCDADTDDRPVYNSYNGDSTWDSVIQFVTFNCDCSWYVLLQTHNGADVRGGYSFPRCYEGDVDGLHFTSDGYICCAKDGNHNWSTDDAYNWHFQGCGGCGAEKRLNDYEIVEVSEIDEVKPLIGALDRGEKELELMCELRPDSADAFKAQYAEETDKLNSEIAEKASSNIGFLCVDDNDNGYCPLCGGRLEACG